MTSGNLPAVVGRYFEAIRQMDPEAWVQCFAEQGVSCEPGAPVPLQGHATLCEFIRGVLEAFKNIELTADHVFLSGNRAAVKFTGRGTGKNGREVIFEGIDVFEINQDGNIQTMWGYWDPAAMLAQLQG